MVLIRTFEKPESTAVEIAREGFCVETETEVAVDKGLCVEIAAIEIIAGAAVGVNSEICVETAAVATMRETEGVHILCTSGITTHSAKVQFCSFLSIESHMSYSEPLLMRLLEKTLQSIELGAQFVYRKLGRA